METNNLRPIYNMDLPSLDNELTSRGMVFKLIADGSRVLDVGCDTGLFGRELIQQKKCIVDGVEAYEQAANIAKRNLSQVLIRNIVNEQSFQGFSNYDAILFMDVLEHLIDIWAILRGAWQTLQPGGKIYIVVPNVAHIAVIRRLMKGEFEYSDYGTMDRTHLRWFTRKSLKQALEATAFINVKINVTTQILFLQSDAKIGKLLSKQLTSIFPDQLGGSIVAQAEKPIR
jgi:2-polyprenyl-3-methyl-5-hydroxy-6-metoxy-1,4-benzoquinol methylase